MPRHARNKSASGYMHVIVRGIGKQLLFEDDYDYKYYLKKLETYCMDTEVSVCAYCLMDNHVHLLVKGESEAIVLLMKKIGVSYSWYYNKKYDRVGHLFQDRYKSEPIENEKYLLTAFRYILKNPEKAGICSAARYPWNSFWFYDKPLPYMDLSAVKATLGDFGQYREFIEQKEDDQGLEYSETWYSDTSAKELMERCLGITSGTALQNYSREKRDEALITLKEYGLTVRQIERLTGIGRGVVQDAGKKRSKR
ncbi:MAG: transposase [Butyrivibrio sp.]|uniref:transposase n=1 Tax=Butyrivibrio sp. TaxID=28121 RepID=UPI001B50BE15|nr:transposase [Butyrivibrio sp.]MBP3783146.1 transposase [Butyrivibrio sp.]